jgi:hypothetical protein
VVVVGLRPLEVVVVGTTEISSHIDFTSSAKRRLRNIFHIGTCNEKAAIMGDDANSVREFIEIYGNRDSVQIKTRAVESTNEDQRTAYATATSDFQKAHPQ